MNNLTILKDTFSSVNPLCVDSNQPVGYSFCIWGKYFIAIGGEKKGNGLI